MTERESKPEAKRERRWSVKWTIIVCLPILLVTLYFGWRLALKVRVERELAWYRAQGFPTDLGELRAWYPWPKGDNAADVYDDALRAVPIAGPGRKLPTVWGRTLGAPLSAKELRDLRDSLKPWDVALGHVEKAALIPECRFVANVRTGPGNAARPFTRLYMPAYALGCRALLRAGTGKGDLAADDVRRQLAIERALGNTPSSAVAWSRLSLVRLTSDTLEQTLGLTAASPAKLKQLAADIRPAPVVPAFTRAAVLGAVQSRERMGQLSAEMLHARYGGSSALDNAIRAVYVALGGSDLVSGDLLRLTRRGIETVRALRARPAAVSGTLRGLSKELPRLGLVRRYAHIEVPWRTAGVCAARLRVLQAAVAAERCRLDHGRLPKSLKDTVPTYLRAVPLDPFDGKPLRARPRGTALVIYSVGPNGRDDLGRAAPKGDDISFRLLQRTPKGRTSP